MGSTAGSTSPTRRKATPANSFDGKGGLTVAIVDNALYTLPKLGRFAWENTIAQPNHGTQHRDHEHGGRPVRRSTRRSRTARSTCTSARRTAAPAPACCDATASTTASCTCSSRPTRRTTSEAGFSSGSIEVEWKLIPNAGELDRGAARGASDAAGAFRFARPEDGAFNKRDRERVLLRHHRRGAPAARTRSAGSTRCGLHPGNVTQGGTLSVVYNADNVIAAGGDIAISPDNIDASENYLMINEDGTA